MSLILEALRKSEAERRRGQAPGLFTHETNVRAPAAVEKSRALLIATALLLLAFLAYGAWRWTQAAGNSAALPAADAKPEAAQPETIENTGTSTATASTPVPTSPATASPAPTAAIAPASPPPAVAATRAPPASSMPSPMPALRLPTPLPATSTAVTAEQPNTSDPPAVTLAALSNERRSQLPPLKLSMHVYADDAAKRFAIIDGQRLSEGSRIGNAIVSAIRRDGVLLDIDGERYLLPRP